MNQETTTGLRLENETFQYEFSREGDGTVPLDLAELPGATTYYVEESHGSLPNNRNVSNAVIDVLRTGETKELDRSWVRRKGQPVKTLSEATLRAAPFEKKSASALTVRERRELLEELVSSMAHEHVETDSGHEPHDRNNAGGGRGMMHSLKNVAITRRREHSIEICLAQGNITEIHSRATVLGLFAEVEPAGAAGAIDERLKGAVKEFTTRRMFSGAVGEVFAMPTGRHLIYAETVLFTGLGNFDAFRLRGPRICGRKRGENVYTNTCRRFRQRAAWGSFRVERAEYCLQSTPWVFSWNRRCRQQPYHATDYPLRIRS